MIRRSELSALSWEIVWFYEFVMLLPYPALRSQALGITSLCRCGLCCKCSLLLPLFSVIICVLFFFFTFIVCMCTYTQTTIYMRKTGGSFLELVPSFHPVSPGY